MTDPPDVADPPGRPGPPVSIVVCFLDAVAMTARCVDHVRKHTDEDLFELILVDDGSTDPDARQLADLPGVRLVRSEENVGFTGAANLGARQATGEFLVFLNNDTEVEPGWLDALLDAARSGPDVGAVGAMLLNTDGTVQEAGGIIWSDGTGMNYGRGRDAGDPAYRYRREVDYCSGACLLVDRRLFETVGGFDECFAPGYYEDTDLCFSLRSQGHVVLYEPGARVVHHEGATFGTEEVPGTSTTHTKSGQHLNRLLFQAKWAEELLHHFPSRTAGGRRGGRVPDRPRVLVSDNDLYPPDQSSGGQRMAWILLLLHELGCEVTFFPFDRTERQPYADWLRRAGVEVVCTGDDLATVAAERQGLYDLVVLCRPTVAARQREVVRRYFPDAVVVYDTVDLHFVRAERELALARADGDGSDEAEHTVRRARRSELDEVRAADVVSTVTGAEGDLLRTLVSGLDTVELPNVHGVRTTPVPGPAGRADLLFIGGYRHRPNVDAVSWFTDEVLPLVRRHEPARFIALGANPPAAMQALASDTVVIPGYRNDVSADFDAARVFVAPLRYGAGMKGKLGQAMAFGLPVVTTSVGAEGMGLVDGEHVLVADDPEAFAEAVLRLYRDDELWERLSAGARELAAETWSPAAMKVRLTDLMSRTRARGSMVPRSWGRLDPEGPIGPLVR